MCLSLYGYVARDIYRFIVFCLKNWNIFKSHCATQLIIVFFNECKPQETRANEFCTLSTNLFLWTFSSFCAKTAFLFALWPFLDPSNPKREGMTFLRNFNKYEPGDKAKHTKGRGTSTTPMRNLKYVLPLGRKESPLSGKTQRVATKHLVHKYVSKEISLPEFFLLIPNSIKYA